MVLQKKLFCFKDIRVIMIENVVFFRTNSIKMIVFEVVHERLMVRSVEVVEKLLLVEFRLVVVVEKRLLVGFRLVVVVKNHLLVEFRLVAVVENCLLVEFRLAVVVKNRLLVEFRLVVVVENRLVVEDYPVVENIQLRQKRANKNKINEV